MRNPFIPKGFLEKKSKSVYSFLYDTITGNSVSLFGNNKTNNDTQTSSKCKSEIKITNPPTTTTTLPICK